MAEYEEVAREGAKVPSQVLVVGAGISGIKASLDLAELGFFVHLIEDKPFIGGTLSQLDSQFPTNDCGMCKMLPYLGSEFCSDLCLRRGLDHPNINVQTNTELISLEGDLGNFKVQVRKKARLVDLEKCIACNLCVDVCPIEVEHEFNQKLSNRKAIYIRYPSAIPCVYAIDTDSCNKCGECVKVCPTNAINLLQEDKEEEIDVGTIILALGFEPFDPSEITSLHYADYKNVITALELERSISGIGPYLERQLNRPSDKKTPINIAFLQCVGSRDEARNYCSYACCMHSLKEAMMVKKLHPDINVTVFFMDMRVFGKGYHRYYEDAKKMGINFVRSRVASIEKDDNENLLVNYVDENDEPKQESFEMVVLATGQNPPRNAEKLGEIIGIKLDKYGFCTPEKGSAVRTSKPGVFICGALSSPKDIPDSMIEASAAALMASSVLRKEMQGHEDITQELKQEEEDKAMIEEAIQKDNETIGVFICKCESCIADSLNMHEIIDFTKSLSDVAFVEGVNFLCLELEDIKNIINDKRPGKILFGACALYPFEVKFKKAVASAGINPSLLEIVNLREGCAWVHEDKQTATQKAKSMMAMANEKLRNQEALQITSKPVVPNALVIGGGISGMTAALHIATCGYPVDLIEKGDKLGGNAKHIYHTLDGLDVQKFLRNVEDDINKNNLITVHKNTDVEKINGRAGGFLAELKNPSMKETNEYGTVIIATGANELSTQEYLYGQLDLVITQRELEKKLEDGSFDAKNIVMIQCVDLRDEKRQYCGRICCSQAIKNALKIKEIDPNTNVNILYRDIVTYGFAEEFYIRAKEKGINFVRYELETKPEVTQENGGLKVKVKDIVLNDEILIDPDLLVLSLGPSPENNIAIAEIFKTKLELDEDGFLAEANVKFRPVDFVREGIFVCGLAHSPRSLVESIAQAKAAAGRALTILSKKSIMARRLISDVNERWCVGCEACILACPYDARFLENENKVAKVVDALCQGCGICAAVCPSGAAKLKGYREKQMMAVIDEALLLE